MFNDKRSGGNAIPEPVYKLLNNDQLHTFNRLADDGWEVCFVRKPSFRLRIIVLHKADGDQYAILNEDGTVDVESELEIR